MEYIRYKRDKFKECMPEETVKNIKSILSSLGAETTETWTDTGIEGCCSVRIEINGMAMGQNGKGTTRAYALASGYAELMERLQTGFLYPFGYDKETDEYCGFRYAQDEVLETPERLAELGGELLRDSLVEIRRQDAGKPVMPWALNTETELKRFSYAAEDGRLYAVPFNKLGTEVVEYLPWSIYTDFFFTNGSCAGNSKEEALIQGMSEIAERYAASKIMKERLTPPVIPEERLAEIPELYETILAIKNIPDMDLRIMDASCGMGLPVIASAVIDRSRGCYVLRFGAHPRFEVALERSLTEILQGRNVKQFDAFPRFDFALDEYAQTPANRFSFLKAAYGVYPTELFGNSPSWEYEGFSYVEEELKSHYEYLKALLERIGKAVYVRDCSFLGFPTYHIVVPAMSMLFDFGSKRIGERKLHQKVLETLRNPYDANEEALTDAEKFLIYKRGWYIEDTWTYLAKIPLSFEAKGAADWKNRALFGNLSMPNAAIMIAMLELKKEAWKEAASCLQPLAWTIVDGKNTVTGFYVLMQLALGRAAGLDTEQAAARILQFCSQDQMEWAVKIMNDPLSLMPSVHCFKCEECSYKKNCGYPEARRLRRAIKTQELQNKNLQD